MNTLPRALLLASALATALPALADPPCTSEMASFCSDVQPGNGRVASCLRSRWPELSDSCRNALDKAQYKARVFIGDCEVELFSVCADIPATAEAVLACLGDHSSDLTPACKTAYDKAKNAPNRLQSKCGSEISMFCSSTPAGDTAGLRACLLGRASELSAACRAEVSP